MNRKSLFLSGFSILLLVFLFTPSAQAVDKYWISFNGTGGAFKYLMQIDQSGNITIQPKAILKYDVDAVNNNGEPVNPYGSESSDTAGIRKGPLDGPCSTALSDHGTGSIDYFLITSQGTLFRSVINKATLTPTTTFPVAIRRRGFRHSA